MKPSILRPTALAGFIALLPSLASPSPAAVHGWLEWRGQDQTGTSRETHLPDKIDAKNALWVADFPGQSTPVIADGHLYINGHLGDGPDLQEYIGCFDAETGRQLWSHAFNDFLSDTIYLRYATSAPSVDEETGNVYMQGTQGILACFTRDGKLLWQHSLMEEYGRLTFPNGRTASPVIDRELVITRGITSSWGAHGPAGDRFYAFDKKTGELAWSSAPGDRPQDNTFSQPWLDLWNGQRVLYSAGGDCTLVALNARTGEPLWRVPVAKAGAKGGINAAVIRYGDNLIVIHESENLDSSEIGRMAAMKIPASITKTNPLVPHIFTPKQLEQWRNDVGSLAS
ncbi:MAG TPA: PQQ-binding-like beta-propeller repeat protein, partial [Candidatus Dormibacteraeota bacterium]|nr:PQQ-binding-like beta-propeller repeat protein [Candidatus Dormibacteraeota bacterium]